MRNFLEVILRARQALEFSHSQDPSETSNLIASEAGWVPFPSRWPGAKC